MCLATYNLVDRFSYSINAPHVGFAVYQSKDRLKDFSYLAENLPFLNGHFTIYKKKYKVRSYSNIILLYIYNIVYAAVVPDTSSYVIP